MATKKKLKKVIDDLNKKFGKEAVSMGGMQEIEKEPTEILSLDRIIGGGFPRSRFTIIWGPESVGKTSLCLDFAATIESQGKKVGFIDAESTADKNYAVNNMGLNPDNCIYSKPDDVEELGDTVIALAPHLDLVIVDSITAVGSKQELDKDLDDNSMALLPRKLSQFFRMVTGAVGKSNCVVIFVAQVRTHGIGSLYSYLDYSGGNALRHHNALTLGLRRGSKKDYPKDNEGNVIGFPIKIKVDKTKVSGTEGQEAMLTYFYDPPHFRAYDDVFKVALLEGVIKRGGAWYSFGDTKTQGQDDFIQLLKEDKKLFKEIKKKIMEEK